MVIRRNSYHTTVTSHRYTPFLENPIQCLGKHLQLVRQVVAQHRPRQLCLSPPPRWGLYYSMELGLAQSSFRILHPNSMCYWFIGQQFLYSWQCACELTMTAGSAAICLISSICAVHMSQGAEPTGRALTKLRTTSPICRLVLNLKIELDSQILPN